MGSDPNSSLYNHMIYPHPNLISIFPQFVDFKGKEQKGELIVHFDVSKELIEIFQELLEIRFPIFQMKPISHFNNDDSISMNENNCYAYGLRKNITRPNEFSTHAYGLAVDINPIQNPYIRGPLVLPQSGIEFVENRSHTGCLTLAAIHAFESRGWTWGGKWQDRIDLHHFEKRIPHIMLD